MSVRKLSAIFNNTDNNYSQNMTTDNNSSQNMTTNQGRKETVQTYKKDKQNSESHNKTKLKTKTNFNKEKSENQGQHSPKTLTKESEDIQTTNNVLKFKRIFENEDNNNVIGASSDMTIKKNINVSENISSSSNNIQKTKNTEHQISSNTKKVSSNIANDSNFKTVLAQKLENSRSNDNKDTPGFNMNLKQIVDESSSSLHTSKIKSLQKDLSKHIPMKQHPKNQFSPANQYLKMDGSVITEKETNFESSPPKLPPRIPKYFVKRNNYSSTSPEYLNTTENINSKSTNSRKTPALELHFAEETDEIVDYDCVKEIPVTDMPQNFEEETELVDYSFVKEIPSTMQNKENLNPPARNKKLSISLESLLDPDAPPLPPRNYKTSSTLKKLNLPSVSSKKKMNYTNVTLDTTQNIVEEDSLSFDSESSTNELQKMFATNEQMETSNSIEVEEKISNIIYGKKSMTLKSSRNNHFVQNRSNETLDDKFGSEHWDSEHDDFDCNASLSTKTKLDALPLKELLDNQHMQNFEWSDIMTKLYINTFQLNDTGKLLQNAKYQLVVGEWSFLKSMNILHNHFVEQLFILLTGKESDTLFGYIKEVKNCSQDFMNDLEKCWMSNKFADNFCEVIYNNLLKRFDVYVQYVGNQVHSEALLGEIISDKSRTFNDMLSDIQNDPICNGLHLHAYQLIPIRKINNLPYLLENVLRYLTPQDREYEYCRKSLDILKQLLNRCDKESKLSKDQQRTKSILEKLDFPKNAPLIVGNTSNILMRKFIKSDKMVLIESYNGFFGKKVIRKQVYVFLFNDLFVVARYRGSNRYQVLDYCFRINLELDSNPILLHLGINKLNTILYLRIKENSDLKPTEMVLDCETRTDAIRWTESLDPPDTASANNNFDFELMKSVIVRRNYLAVHSDEINLTIGDVYKIIRETEDGWSFGQREKDGECGWFQTENVALLVYRNS